MRLCKWFSVALVLVVWLLLAPSGTHAQTDLACDDLGPPGVPPEYFVGVGNAFYDQGEYALTVVAYTCAIDLDAEYAPAYVNRGFAYATQRDDVAAMADYNRALEIDESLVAAYNNRGMLYMSQGNFGLAINDFTLAVSLDPDYAIGYHNRGLVHAAEGNYDLAIADFEQAIALDPEYAAPYASLGAVYSALSLDSYQQYTDMTQTRLPGGEPDTIINALDASQESGNFAIWLAFLTPAQ
ncbi:MAG: tetratricopeptide repeat protein [Chloroflexi bacterium]|nr:tetratricopeptide repeat protein [Chloroflexota bacterium]